MGAVAALDQLAYRPAQAAQAIGVSERQMWEWIGSGRIASVKTGDARNSPRLVRREALVAYLDQLERDGAS